MKEREGLAGSLGSWSSFGRDLWQCLGGEGKEAKDYEKENVRRIKEIQRKCKEKERAQEHSQPKPVKALWKSQKYENVESKVKAKLQVGICGEALELSRLGEQWDDGDRGVLKPAGSGGISVLRHSGQVWQWGSE
ncbi:hypothetical protein EK904_013314 [Melospiza melodia maxima]|nr:hypothetical protein EK904_013314 [Melospiza melodia maxima]